ncbi:MAG: phosphoribosylformylglycinamidine cyclo-ligase [Thermicanus sp.]|nr:phosphoribosylformylglycinamidine cyclo-ligase [Thermicanus sp.]
MSEAYKKAGVDIEAGYEAVSRMKRHTARTKRQGVLSDLGGFGGLFQLDLKRYREPVLVSGTDGVGTKLKIAFAMGKHDTIGIDCVAMCVNDILVQGAEPLFFLDYIGIGRLDPGTVEEIVSGVAEGCVQAGCALIGGETAEMPGLYQEGEYDLAGFAVGVVEKGDLLDGSRILPGDLLVGIASSGLHSNGFSLVRRLLLTERGYSLEQYLPELGKRLGEELLTPTKIYVKSLTPILKHKGLKGMAHITGGGLVENIPRMLPKGVRAEIDFGSWPIPPIFELLRREGNLSYREMVNTFNMGIGMVLVLANEEEEVMRIIRALEDAGEKVYPIGRVAHGEGGIYISGVDQG